MSPLKWWIIFWVFLLYPWFFMKGCFWRLWSLVKLVRFECIIPAYLVSLFLGPQIGWEYSKLIKGCFFVIGGVFLSYYLWMNLAFFFLFFDFFFYLFLLLGCMYCLDLVNHFLWGFLLGFGSLVDLLGYYCYVYCLLYYYCCLLRIDFFLMVVELLKYFGRAYITVL